MFLKKMMPWMALLLLLAVAVSAQTGTVKCGDQLISFVAQATTDVGFTWGAADNMCFVKGRALPLATNTSVAACLANYFHLRLPTLLVGAIWLDNCVATQCSYLNVAGGQQYGTSVSPKSSGRGIPAVLCRDIDECLSNPCRNNATCRANPNFNDYTCKCAVGYTGKNCEIDIDDCVMQTCPVGSTCQDHVNSYTCLCPAGFTGAKCLTATTAAPPATVITTQNQPSTTASVQAINHCTAKPCQNDGTCVNNGNSYTCYCAFGYTGTNCGTATGHRDGHCAGTPCKNGGLCYKYQTYPSPNPYTCQCAVGYRGRNCDIVEYCSENLTVANGHGVSHGTFEAQTVDTPVSAVARVTCDQNYILNGSENIVCQSDRTWGPTVPNCLRGFTCQNVVGDTTKLFVPVSNLTDHAQWKTQAQTRSLCEAKSGHLPDAWDAACVTEFYNQIVTNNLFPTPGFTLLFHVNAAEVNDHGDELIYTNVYGLNFAPNTVLPAMCRL